MIALKLGANKLKANPPPIALVKTWIVLVRSQDIEIEVRNRATKMLKDKIGETEDILNFIRENNIKIE